MDPRTTRQIMNQVERPDARSPLFHWLYEHHDELLARAPSGRISWKHLCGLMAAAGLTDLRGQAPTPALAKLTWQRVRRAVAAARARTTVRAKEEVAASGRGKARSRLQPVLTAASTDEPVRPNGAGVLEPHSQGRKPKQRRWYDDDPNVPPEVRERMRAEDERLEAQSAKAMAIHRLG
jgi:hypothetical protein